LPRTTRPTHKIPAPASADSMVLIDIELSSERWWHVHTSIVYVEVVLYMPIWAD